MANLPPRPESPLRMRDDRRYLDDRERRPAQPMAPRFRGDRDRHSDERVYVPRPRPDTYIAPGFESRREIDGRRTEYDDRDRDRHRSFDRDRDSRDRDRRNWDHERDGPRRWELGTDRDRRPYDRGRPLLSPQRRAVSHRVSRSPPRRRPPSPPASYRSRPRSRSRSHSPPRHLSPPSKRFRPCNYSRVAGSHSRSPYHRRPSRDRSRSRSQVYPQNEVHNSKIKSRAASPDTIKVEQSDPLLISEAPMVEDHNPLSQFHVAEVDAKAPLNTPPDISTLNQTVGSSKLSPLQDDIKPEIRTASPVPQTLETLVTDDQKTIEKIKSISHKPSPQSPISFQAQRSPSPPRAPKNMYESTARALPTGLQPNWPRSPPRQPRSHPRQQPMPPSSAPSYSSAPRAPRRGFPPTGPSSSFSSPASRHNPESKKTIKPLDPDLEIYRTQANRSHLTLDYLQRAKSLRRALHELDLATIDLRAAEIRRQIADSQLEKAINGALGIDAKVLV